MNDSSLKHDADEHDETDPFASLGIRIVPVHQEGGKLLGQGAYGCIFDPPLLCRGKEGQGPAAAAKSVRKLGKLTSARDMSQELYTANYFKGVAGVKDYLVLPELPACKPKARAQQKEPDMGKCDVLGKVKLSEMYQYSIEYGGQTFGDIKDKLAGSPTFNFGDFVRHLLELGTFLVIHRFVHNDFHSGNILINDKGRPRLIDFGRSYAVDQISQQLVIKLLAQFDAGLGQIPPESTAIDGIAEGHTLSFILEELRTKKSDLRSLERLLGLSRQKQIDEFRRFWLSSRAAKEKDGVAMYKYYWSVVDSWAIGHNILRLLVHQMLPQKRFREGEFWKQKQSLIKTILRGLLRMSPRDRFDAVEALALYDPTNKLIASGPGRAWLERKVEQREQTKRRQRGGAAGADVSSDDSDVIAEDDYDEF